MSGYRDGGRVDTKVSGPRRVVPVRGRGALLDILDAVPVRGADHAGARPRVPLRAAPLRLVLPDAAGHPRPELLVGRQD